MSDMIPRPFAADEEIRELGGAFLSMVLPREKWTHEAHIAVCAWILIEREEMIPERDLPLLIRRFNESVGGTNDEMQGYHETITQCFIRGVRMALRRSDVSDPLVARINAVLRAPEGRREWPMRFYSRERLFSVPARLGWIEPDLDWLPDLPRGG